MVEFYCHNSTSNQAGNDLMEFGQMMRISGQWRMPKGKYDSQQELYLIFFWQAILKVGWNWIRLISLVINHDRCLIAFLNFWKNWYPQQLSIWHMTRWILKRLNEKSSFVILNTYPNSGGWWLNATWIWTQWMTFETWDISDIWWEWGLDKKTKKLKDKNI